MRLCAELGHHVEEADPEIERGAVVPTFITLAAANTVVNLSSASDRGAARPRGRGGDGHLEHREARASARSSADYVRATQTAHRLGRQMAAFHRDYDVLLTPGLASSR